MLMRNKVDSQLKTYIDRERKQYIIGEDVGKGNGEMVGGRYHCFVVRSFDFIGTAVPAAALWKDTRITSERHLSMLCCRRAQEKKKLLNTLGASEKEKKNASCTQRERDACYDILEVPPLISWDFSPHPFL